MIYIIMIVLVIVVAIIGHASRGGKQFSRFSFVILLYATTLWLFLLYLCKDPYYLGLFLEYIPLPRFMILQMYTMRISRASIVRLLNVNSLLFIVCNVAFSADFEKKRLNLVLPAAVAAISAIPTVLFDPAAYRAAYSFLYPTVMDSDSVARLYDSFSTFSRVFSASVLAACIAATIAKAFQGPKIQLIRLTMSAVSISYTLLLLSYILFFNRLPALLVKYSKVADMLTFRPLITNSTMTWYRLFPYVAFVFLALFCVSFFQLTRLRLSMAENNLRIAQGIKAANVSSRLFCHYMKNEILAVSMELEQLKLTDENRETVENARSRCGQIYKKLDGIHRSMQDDSMSMCQVRISDVLAPALERLAAERKSEGVEVVVDISPESISAFVDATYLEQALENLFHNACEAMGGQAEKRLSVTARRSARWVSIDISDTGCGIAEKDLMNIFIPLFSSKPMSQNWGIGLTLAHKIIYAFGGSISVKSKPGAGTVFQILLPAMRF
ncbi:MAG: hypothetical protein LBC41_06425 [Clostridiales bacterium]|jgi:signal transduction histidine kinase|nr:hypothetical protein [Clostridiales bacterium]MDR2750277.1 hypothetical protein [Clostridiales bacterium]